MKSISRAAIALLLVFFCSSSGGASLKIKSLCGLHYPGDAAVPLSCLKLKWTDTPEKLFGNHWQDVLRFNRMDRRHFIGEVSIKVPKRLEEIRDYNPLPTSYPDASNEAKFILVDQSEMFLGAYEYGKLLFSYPVAIGIENHRVPNGSFRIDAADRDHESNLYTVEEIGRPYPMHYGLRFLVDKSMENTPSYWIHGRDVPGYPASHGCIGLFDEEMQYAYYNAYDRQVNKPYYHELTRPFLEAAKRLYLWAVGPGSDPGTFREIKNGPRVLIIGEPPL